MRLADFMLASMVTLRMCWWTNVKMEWTIPAYVLESRSNMDGFVRDVQVVL